MQKQKLALNGQATQDVIDNWKKEHKNIYAIEVDGHIGYFREPTRDDANFAASQLDPDSPYDFFETVMRETKIGGSEALLNEDALYLGALQLVKKKVDGKKAKLVNL